MDQRHIVRIANTDLKGTKHILFALADIKGVGVMFANAVCAISGTDKQRKVGTLTDEEVRRLDEIIKNPLKFGLPEWMLDRRKDPETGKDLHLVTNDLVFAQENDVKMMKKIKSYKGMRHMAGLPVRGQKVRSNFRKNKGNVMGVKVATKKTSTG